MKRITSLYVVASVLLVACGVPIEEEAERLMIELDQPPQIEEPEPEDLAAVSVYLIRDDVLVHVTRDLPVPTTLETTLESLLSRVSQPEERADLRTSIPPGTRLLGLEVSGGTASLNLSGDFASVGGEEETLAVAQIVLTVTSVDGVSGVEFQLEGVPTDVPVAGGALSVDPVGADQYDDLIGS
jgi:spore germination protein GerM